MKTIFVLTALLITCFGEEYPEETADVFKSKLWKEVIKRLHEAKESEHGGDPESGGLSGLKLNDDLNDRPQYEADASPKCPKGSPNALDSISANTIIKTKDSVMSGATFLSSPRISSAAECLNLCCQKSRCTLAVYENKKKNACYLFDCGVPSRCQFTEHANYTSLTLKKAPPVVEEHVMTTPPSVKENDNHEDELQGLLKPETAKPTEFQPPKTTQQATTQAPALPPTTTVKKIVQVKLFASCSETEVCEEENAECKEQFCVCKEGFRPKNGRCGNKGEEKNKATQSQPGNAWPEDREQQIEPEQKAPYTHRPLVVVPTRPLPPRPTPKMNMVEPKEDIKAKEQVMHNTGHSDVQSHPDKTESQMIHPNQGKTDEGAPKKVPQKNRKHDNPTKQEVQVEAKQDMVVKPDYKDQKSNIKHTDQSKTKSESHQATKVLQSKPTATVDRTVEKNVQVQPHVDTPDSDSESSFFPYSGSQGAIVALSLSLAITVILILFLGCRLRTVKRRLKRGRVLTSNEADYLINGMYL